MIPVIVLVPTHGAVGNFAVLSIHCGGRPNFADGAPGGPGARP